MSDLLAPDFRLEDQAGRPWTLSEQLDAAVVLVFYRGDW
jgi:peroxiredoxin